MKCERFIIEYANSKIRACEHNDLMNPGIKNEIIRRASRGVRLRELGMITADEAICIIGGFYPKVEYMSIFAIDVKFAEEAKA